MSEKRSTDQRLDQRVRGRIGQQLRDYYDSKLPPRLLEVLKKLDEETDLSAEQAQVIDDIKR
jgi:hypothetical protein